MPKKDNISIGSYRSLDKSSSLPTTPSVPTYIPATASYTKMTSPTEKETKDEVQINRVNIEELNRQVRKDEIEYADDLETKFGTNS